MEAAEGAGNSETKRCPPGVALVFRSLSLSPSREIDAGQSEAAFPGKTRKRRRRGVSCTHTRRKARAKKVTLCRRKHSE